MQYLGVVILTLVFGFGMLSFSPWLLSLSLLVKCFVPCFWSPLWFSLWPGFLVNGMISGLIGSLSKLGDWHLVVSLTFDASRGLCSSNWYGLHLSSWSLIKVVWLGPVLTGVARAWVAEVHWGWGQCSAAGHWWVEVACTMERVLGYRI